MAPELHEESSADSARTRRLRDIVRDRVNTACRAQVLEIAEQMLLSAGPRNLHMSDLANVAGVSVGTLYNYFQSKEELTLAVIEHQWGTVLAQLSGAFDTEDPAEQLTVFARRLQELSHQRKGLLELLVTWEQQASGRGATPSEAWPFQENGPAAVIDNRLQLTATVRAILERGINRGVFRADMAAARMCSILTTLLTQLLLTDDHRLIFTEHQAPFDAIMSMFLRGVATDRSPSQTAESVTCCQQPPQLTTVDMASIEAAHRD